MTIKVERNYSFFGHVVREQNLCVVKFLMDVRISGVPWGDQEALRMDVEDQMSRAVAGCVNVWG